MASDRLILKLIPAGNDPSPESAEYQKELGKVTELFRSRGVKAAPRVRVLKAAGATSSLLGEFAITIAPTILPALTAILGGWIGARYGRKVRLKIGDVEAEGRTIQEIEKLLEKVNHNHRRVRRTSTIHSEYVPAASQFQE